MIFNKKKKNASMMITDEEVSVEGEENVGSPLQKIKDKMPFLNKEEKDKEKLKEELREELKEELRKEIEQEKNHSIDDKKDSNDLVDIKYDENDEKEEKIKEDNNKEEDKNHNNDLVDIKYDEDDNNKKKPRMNKINNKDNHEEENNDFVEINYGDEEEKENKKKHKKNNDTEHKGLNIDFIKNNSTAKSVLKKTMGLISDIVIIILIGYLIVWLSPKIVNWFSGGREKYVDLASTMTARVQSGFNVSRKGCTTTINHRYFFNIYNSKEQFGDDFVSPIDGQPMQGYIEFEAYDKNYTTYITLSDGFFGVNHVKIEDLDKSDIKIFTFLGLDTYEDMKCNKPIEITKK